MGRYDSFMLDTYPLQQYVIEIYSIIKYKQTSIETKGQWSITKQMQQMKIRYPNIQIGMIRHEEIQWSFR